jgi:hypothetical protein
MTTQRCVSLPVQRMSLVGSFPCIEGTLCVGRRLIIVHLKIPPNVIIGNDFSKIRLTNMT